MPKKKFPTDQTTCIDDCICPYCGYKFYGKDACNANMDTVSVDCPDCGKSMYVDMSVEYMCTVIDE